jgi:hypothetical protein
MSCTTCTKRAVRRDPSVLAGQPAKLFLICGCGHEVTIYNPAIEGPSYDPDADAFMCGWCGERYDGRGYVLRYSPGTPER